MEKGERAYVTSLVPLLLDATAESQSDFAILALQDLPGDYENEMHAQVMGMGALVRKAALTSGWVWRFFFEGVR